MARFNYGCETICNENDIYPAMKILVEDEGMSETAAGKFVEKDSGGQVTWRRARDAYRARKKPDAIATKPKPKRKHTKPETKSALLETVKAIEENGISDDDAKRIIDVVAEKVEKEVIHPRVISKAVKADREYHKRRKRAFIKPVPSQVELLNRKLADCSEQLELLAQGDVQITLTDQKYLASIKAKSLSIMWSYHDLGVDLAAVYRFIVGRKEIGDGKFSDTNIQPENIITVE